MKNFCSILLLISASVILGQTPGGPLPGAGGTRAGASATAGNEALTVNDQLVISARGVAGLSEAPYRIDADGTITLPLVGKIRAEGLTIEQFQSELTQQLAVYVRSPQVSVRRVVTRTDTIMVAGAFKNPGVYPLAAGRPLLDVITAVGGLQPNVRTIKITRRLDGLRNPLRGGIEDPDTGVTAATVNLTKIIENGGLGGDLLIEPQDVLLAQTTGPAIVTGEVLRPGSFDLGGRDSFGFTELISLAGGLGKDAVPQKSKILRPILNGSRRAEIDVDAKSILDGQVADFQVLPNDIVVVPRSKGKARTVAKTLMYLVPAAMSTLIYIAVR